MFRPGSWAAWLLLVAIAIGSASACGTVCQWQCDDPQCNSTCTPVCLAPQCSVLCPNQDPNACNEMCPQCETECHHVSCAPGISGCQVLCQEPECTWQCRMPAEPSAYCLPPVCRLACQHPACGSVSDAGRRASGASPLALLLLLPLILRAL
jgi:hypothetical protein